MKKEPHKMPIKTMLLLFGFIPFMIIVLISNFVSINNIRSEMKEGTYNTLCAAAEGVNQYFAYDIIANGTVDYEKYSDHKYMECLKRKGIELSLFKDNVVLLTSLKDENGRYTEGALADQTIYETVKNGKEYFGEGVTINGSVFFVYYIPIYDGNNQIWGMAFAGITDENVSNAIISAIKETLIVSIVVALLVSAGEAAVATYIAGKMVYASGMLAYLSKGDLTQKGKGKGSHVKEVQQIIDATQTLQRELVTSVGGVRDASINLSRSIDRVNDSSEHLVRGTAVITQSVGELSVAAFSMSETVQSTNMIIMNMGDAISRISSMAEESTGAADSMSQSSETTSALMSKVSLSNQQSVEAINSINDLTKACADSVGRIKWAAEVIKDMAIQTNLLALNARIEAARAGNSGKGFAVIANNIKSLAEQSGSAASEIDGYVVDIVDKVEQCVVASKKAEDIMREQNGLVVSASSNMETLRRDVAAVAKNISEISGNAKNLDREKEKVLKNITDLSAISEENAANSAEVNDTVNTIAAAIEQTKEESGAMQKLAAALDEKMKAFKID